MSHTRRLISTALVAVLATSVVACSGSSDSGQPAQTSESPARHLEPGSEHDIVDAAGRFAYPPPRLARGVSIEPADGGGATMRFAVAYEVANASSADGVAADTAEIEVRIARSRFPTGPQPDDLVFRQQLSDGELGASDGVREYEVSLPPEAVQFLSVHGLSSPDPDTQAEARQLVAVGVQQYRDLQVVDGHRDWIFGTVFDGAQSPTQPADNPGGALTLRNDTGTGIYDVNFNGLEPPAQNYGQGLFPSQDQFSLATSDSNGGVGLALAGEAVSCFYQGNDGSNPEGFNVNLSPGDAVTQTIVADDSSVNLPNNNTAAASVSGAIEYTLKVGVAALNVAASIAFGGPFTLIVAMATNLINLSQYCNNQPNLFQVGAVAATGQAANSTTWSAWDGCSGTCGGFANYYSSPLRSDAPDIDASIATNAVQLAPDSVNTYDGQPLWLAQVPIAGCGVGDASNSNTSGCTSQNVISLRWTTSPACPWTNGYQEYSGSITGNVSWCYLPAPTSPEVSGCGTSNAGCASYDPNG